MSDTIWLEVTDGTEKTGGDRDNTILLKLGTQLDALAEKLGVAKPSSFYDNSALADETRASSTRPPPPTPPPCGSRPARAARPWKPC
jgi:hypothetical protein